MLTLRERLSLSDLVNGQLVPTEALRLFEEIEGNKTLSRALEDHIELVNLVRSPEGRQLFESPHQRRISFLKWPDNGPIREHTVALRLRRLTHVSILIAVSLLIWGVTFQTMWWGATSETTVALECGELVLRLRAFSDDELSTAAALIAGGKYRAGADRLERFARLNPECELALWAEHVAGVIRIVGARRAILGISSWVDQDQVRQGIDHLRIVEGRLRIPRIEEEGLWYQGIGWLMLGERQMAKAAIEKVVQMAGPRAPEARRTLSEQHLEGN